MTTTTKQQEVALTRVHLTHPVTCPRTNGVGFESATSQFHVRDDQRGAGRCETISLRGGFVVLQMRGCYPTEVPLHQVAWLVRQ